MSFSSRLDLFKGEPVLRLLSTDIKFSWIYLLVATIGFVIPAIAAITTRRAFSSSDSSLLQPFFYDAPSLIQSLISTPLILYFLRKLLTNLPQLIDTLEQKEILHLQARRVEQLIYKYNQIGNNRYVYLFCLLFTIPTNYLWLSNFLTNRTPTYQISIQEYGEPAISLAGWFNVLFMITPFMYIAFIALYKVAIIVLFLFDVNNVHKNAGKPTLTCQPLHPDRAAGLSAVSKISSAFSLPFLSVGLALAAIIYSEIYVLDTPSYPIYFVEVIAYLLAAVLLFVMPLYPFHGQMLAEKLHTLDLLSASFNRYYQSYTCHLVHQDLEPTQEATLLAKIDRLINLYTTAEKMPVWPFDVATISRFFALVLTPLLLFSSRIIVGLLSRSG